MATRDRTERRRAISNRDLAADIEELSSRISKTEEFVRELSTQLVPLHTAMVEMKGGLKLVGMVVSSLGVLATIASIISVLRGH